MIEVWTLYLIITSAGAFVQMEPLGAYAKEADCRRAARFWGKPNYDSDRFKLVWGKDTDYHAVCRSKLIPGLQMERSQKRKRFKS